jgi:tripartite-type tricarboxylate transporter receptor subunit TctC
LTNVPFAKPAERYASPLGKHTDAIYEEPGDVAQFLTGKQLRPLVVFDDERHASFPDVPNSKELGFSISDLPNFRTVAVPSKTPKDRVDILAAAINKVMETPEWKKFCAETYSCVTKRYAPAEAGAYVKEFYVATQNHLKAMKK